METAVEEENNYLKVHLENYLIIFLFLDIFSRELPKLYACEISYLNKEPRFKGPLLKM